MLQNLDAYEGPKKATGNDENKHATARLPVLSADHPQSRNRRPRRPLEQETPSGARFSFGPPVVAQVQGLLTGHAPVVGLLPQLVVLQGRFVVHWQPLDGVCGQSLRGGAAVRRWPLPVAAAHRRIATTPSGR